MTYLASPLDVTLRVLSERADEEAASEYRSEAFREEFGDEETDPEDRPYVADPDFWEGRATEADWADLDTYLDWEANGE